MKSSRIITLGAIVLSVVFGATAESFASGNTVTVTNTSVLNATLSDLIVYGAGGASATLLAPNNAADDIVMTPNETRILGPVGFTITSYFISRSDLPGGEKETFVITVMKNAPRKIAMVADDAGVQMVALRMDDAVAGATPPSVGTVLPVTNGAVMGVPGWFVGTVIDFAGGNVSSGFTGNIEVVDTAFDVSTVTTIPTVSEWGMLATALVLITAATLFYGKGRAKRGPLPKCS